MRSSLEDGRTYNIVGYKHSVFFISGLKTKDLFVFVKDVETKEVFPVQINLEDPKVTNFVFCPKIYVTLEEWLDYALRNCFDLVYEETANGNPVGSLTHYIAQGHCDLTSSFRVIVDKED
jgi:hypothetical protein